MSGLRIAKAPNEYHLTVGAVEKFCKENSAEDCQKFLKYSLEKSGYTCFKPIKKSAIERKIEALGHENPGVRWKAVDSLIKDIKLHGCSESKVNVITSLIKALKDEKWLIKANAVLILGRIANLDLTLGLKPKMIDPLIKTLEDKNKNVRRVAVWALAKILANSAVPPSLKAKAIRSIIKALGDKKGGVREKAAWALSSLLVKTYISPELKKEMVGPLIKALKDKKNETARIYAAWGLSNLAKSNIPTKLKEEKMLDPLIDALQDEDDNVRGHAVWALGNLIDSNISPTAKAKMYKPLLKATKDEEVHVRQKAFWALQKLVALNISTD